MSRAPVQSRSSLPASDGLESSQLALQRARKKARPDWRAKQPGLGNSSLMRVLLQPAVEFLQPWKTRQDARAAWQIQSELGPIEPIVVPAKAGLSTKHSVFAGITRAGKSGCSSPRIAACILFAPANPAKQSKPDPVGNGDAWKTQQSSTGEREATRPCSGFAF